MNKRVAAITGASATILAALLFGVAHAQSAVLVTGQSGTDTASSANDATVNTQGIGTGLTGTVTTIQWREQGVISSGGGIKRLATLDECTDAAYASCINVGTTVPSGIVTYPSGTSQQLFTAQMVTSYPLDYTKYYKISTGAGGYITLTGTLYMAGTNSPVYTHGSGQLIPGGGSGITAMYYDIIGEFGSNGLTIGSATSSSIFSGQDATSTLADLTAQCSQAGNIFAEGLCVGFSFLFMPSPAIIGGYTNLPADIATRFPISYIVGIKGIFDTLTASSSANMIAPVLDFKDNAPIATTSQGYVGFGNFMPSLTVLSTSTVEQYMPTGLWAYLQSLIAFALWLGLAFEIFFTARNNMWGSSDL